jgi:hypothetical protein
MRRIGCVATQFQLQAMWAAVQSMKSASEISNALAAPAAVTVQKDETAAASPHGPAAAEGSLPTQPWVSVDSLAIAYVIVLHSLAETLFESTAPPNGDADSRATVRRRLEVCAAVWAANQAALEASTLSADERSLMQKVVWQRLALYWKDFCGTNGEISGWVEKRAAEYASGFVRTQPVTTATHIVEELLDAIPVADTARSAKLRALSSLVGHRIVSDVTHFNELKSQFRFV